jgi:hypothetical protein
MAFGEAHSRRADIEAIAVACLKEVRSECEDDPVTTRRLSPEELQRTQQQLNGWMSNAVKSLR